MTRPCFKWSGHAAVVWLESRPSASGIASGAASPCLGGDSGNFGLLEVHDDKVELSLFDEDGLEIQKTVRL